ncbi:GPI-anchored wall transfer protein 1 [Ophiocordyceps camponoti-floridani]|uniref:GPI-anchored wall transfer protein n=1 Tax=Ophiocordyceps camponoti-floridani TaxID=2030778 RepID=A0A8H4QA70_9HYPO|nr:GPI-anchored wall transfer protein 1 [Ophiocordyceps camponoti-floridani]
MADAASYKQRKEAFVSNLSGGSVAEVSVLLWSVLQTRQALFRSHTTLGLALDYALNVGAILLATTVYAGSPVLLDLLLLASAALVYALPLSNGRTKKPRIPPSATDGREEPGPARLEGLPVKPFLTTYRGCMMVVTCVAILAVDFRLFPRRFAKVETWGTSLMDMGVGSFVFAGGVVAARPVLSERMAGRTTPLLRRLAYSARHSVPLLALGGVRLASVKGLDYAEHVTEYGVHWNFFFTLGFLAPLVAVCHSALRIVPSYAGLALLVAGTYEVLLDKTALSAYILVAPRTDLVSMNREGIFSFLGYLAIFLAGLDTGMAVMPRHASGRPPLRSCALRGLAWSGLYWLCTGYSYGFGLSVSRRLANLPYVTWVAAFNSLQLLAFCGIDAVFFPHFYKAVDAKAEKEAHRAATSRVLRAYNRNGLAIFLVANLLTGLVNMTVRTLDAGPVTTMGVLLAYTAAVTGLAVGLDAYDVSIKL